MKRLLMIIGLLMIVFSCSCSFADEGTETLPFQFRLGKVFVQGQDEIQSSLQVRFNTHIFHKNLGISVGTVLGSEDTIYLMDVSYQLVPDVFDFVAGIAGVEKNTVDKGVDLRFNFGANFNVEVFKEIGQKILGTLPF